MTTGPTLPPPTNPDSESDSKRNETPAQTRARLLAEHAERERRKLTARDVSHVSMRSAGPNTVTTRGAEAEAAETPPEAKWQKVGRSIGHLVGGVAAVVDRQPGARVNHPKVLRVNIKDPPAKVPPPANWVEDVVADFESKRQIGDVSAPYLEKIARAYEKLARAGRGCVNQAFASIGKEAKLGRPAGREKESNGRETVRKASRWIEATGWMGTLNTLYRREEDNKLVRDSNVYFLFGAEEAAEAAKLEPAARTLWRDGMAKARGALLWGLSVGVHGLNATTRPDRRKGHPAPA